MSNDGGEQTNALEIDKLNLGDEEESLLDQQPSKVEIIEAQSSSSGKDNDEKDNGVTVNEKEISSVDTSGGSSKRSSGKKKRLKQSASSEKLPSPEQSDGDVPFDFQKFLERLRQKSADPIARYVKSFLHEFGTQTWTVTEQVKIVRDFQTFIAPRIPLYPPFSTLSEPDLNNSFEGMEKLVMNRLYTQTFSPEIPRSKRDNSHEEDILRDSILEQKMRIWSWIEPQHLDMDKKTFEGGERFLSLAQDELLKINSFRAPRDKVICILNCCKVIFGLLKQREAEQSADIFLPILIFVTLKAQPKDLISNIQYVLRFRNPEKLHGEAGYYISSLQGAVSFIETLDKNALTISDEEFERNVELSVSLIAEKGSPVINSECTHFPPSTPDQPPSTPSRGGSNTPSTTAGNTSMATSVLAMPFKGLAKLWESTNSEQDQGPGTEDAQASQINPEESAARQASAEQYEAERISRQEHDNIVSTLNLMFPTLDKEVIDDVLREKQGRVGQAVDVCLTLVA